MSKVRIHLISRRKNKWALRRESNGRAYIVADDFEIVIHTRDGMVKRFINSINQLQENNDK